MFENVGTAFTFTAPGQSVAINEPGLYFVEWTMNLASGNPVSRAGLSANGANTNATSSNSATEGNFTSGTLLNLTAVPYTLSLRNYSGASISLTDAANGTNSAASIFVMKLADRPSV
ncbi:MAG: hypothetical protein LBP79_06635 [Clostridiales bacterium]|nr:hypothetical protein [Clostridiales bacterium]